MVVALEEDKSLQSKQQPLISETAKEEEEEEMKGNMLDKLSAENLSDEGGQQSDEDDPEEAKFGFSDAQLERFKVLYDVAKASI